MKTNLLTLGVFLTVLIGFSGCGGVKPAPSSISYAPTSHQVTFVESSSSAEIMLKATGIGGSIPSATTDAQRAAVWFVLNGGSSPILQTRDEKSKFKNIENDIFKNPLKYISYSSGIKGKQKNAGKYHLIYVFRVNIATLKDELIQKNIVKATEDTLDGADLPKIAVVAYGRDSKNTRHGSTVVSEYLIDRDFEVERLAGGKVDKVFLQIAKNISVDPMAAEMYANALSSGSDIYITVEVSKAQRRISTKTARKVSVSLHAYYTATGKEIGATTGHSPERVVSSYAEITAEASNDAANKLLNQIKKSWKKEAKRGQSYKVIVTTPQNMVNKVKTPLYKALKSTCKKVKPNKSISNILDYTLKCKGVDNYQELEMKISENYTGPGKIFQQAAKGSLLVIKIANSEDDEIEIE